jgi:preprotein translocase subunit SecG
MIVLYFLTLSLFMLLCMVLCFVILIQEGKGGGFGASFGGDAANSLFGTATSDVLRRFTGWLVVAFFTLCVILSLWTASMMRASRPPATPSAAIENLELQ